MKKQVLLTAAVCACLMGCASKKAEPTSGDATTGTEVAVQDAASTDKLGISWWGTQAVHDFLLEVCDKYTEKTSLGIEPTYTSWDSYWQKMNTLSAAGDLPDIMFQDYSVITQYATKDLLEPMDSYIEAGALDMANVDPAQLEGGKVNGKVYGINVGFASLALACDEEMIKEAGMELPGPEMSWLDFEKFCIEYHEKTGKYGSTVKDLIATIDLFAVQARAKGGALFSDDGLGMGYEDDTLIEFYESIKRMHDAGAIPPIDTIVQQTSTEDSPFAKGEAATMVIWSNMYESQVSVKGKQLGLAIIPGTGQAKSMYFKPSQFLCVTTTSDKKDEAVAFINSWVNDSDINGIIAGRRGTPISNVIADEVAGTLNESGQRVFEYMNVAAGYTSPVDPPYPAGTSEVIQEYIKRFESVLFGESTPKEAAAAFRANAENALKAANK